MNKWLLPAAPKSITSKFLKRICKKLGIATKQKALFHVLERFEPVEKERDELRRRVSELESELLAVKQAVRRKVEADENLARCINGH